MGFLGDVLAAWSQPSVEKEGAWRSIGDGYGAGVGSVTEDQALSIQTVWDCNYILCDAIGQMPFLLYDRLPDGGRMKSEDPLAYLMAEQWNGEQSALEFKRTMQQAANFYKYAYAQITWSGGTPTELIPLHPSRVSRRNLGGRAYRYDYLEDDNRTLRPIAPDEMFRVPGKPVLAYAEQTFSQALALMNYSANLFTKGPKPSTVIRSEKGVVFDAAAKLRIKAQIAENSVNAASGGMLWIPEGLDLSPYGMTAQQAELNLMWGTVVAEMARFWRVPPYMLGLLESGTVSYASVSTQGVDFVVYTLMPWLVGWEQAASRDMIVDKRGQFAEFLAAALLRGTTKERYEVYEIALAQGIMSRNDVRRLENMNPIPGGDTYADPASKPAIVPGFKRAETPAAMQLLESLARDAAGRAVRRETSALAKLADRTGADPHAWEAGVKDIYSSHALFLADALKLPLPSAAAYADAQMLAVIADGPAVAATWGRSATESLINLTLEAAR